MYNLHRLFQRIIWNVVFGRFVQNSIREYFLMKIAKFPRQRNDKVTLCLLHAPHLRAVCSINLANLLLNYIGHALWNKKYVYM